MGIKKFHKYLAIILAITLSVAIIAGIASVAIGSNYVYEFYRNAETQSIATESRVITKNIKKIDISEIPYNIEINKSATNETKITLPDDNRIKFVETEDQIKLYQKDQYWKNWTTSFQHWGDAKIIIEIPESVEKIDLQSNVGNVKINDIKMQSLKLDGAVGNTTISHVEITEKIDINAGVGNIKLSNISGNSKMSIDGGVGNIKIDEFKADEVKINAGVGNIDLEKINVEKVKIDAGMGNINIKTSTIKLLSGSTGISKIKISSDCIIEENLLTYTDTN